MSDPFNGLVKYLLKKMKSGEFSGEHVLAAALEANRLHNPNFNPIQRLLQDFVDVVGELESEGKTNKREEN